MWKKWCHYYQTDRAQTYLLHTYISSVLNIYHGMVWKKKLLQPATDNKFPMNTCQKIFLSFCVPIFLDGGTLTWIVESSFTSSSTILHFLAYILCSKSKLINLSVLYFVKARPAIKFVMVHAHAVLFFIMPWLLVWLWGCLTPRLYLKLKFLTFFSFFSKVLWKVWMRWELVKKRKNCMYTHFF